MCRHNRKKCNKSRNKYTFANYGCNSCNSGYGNGYGYGYGYGYNNCKSCGCQTCVYNAGRNNLRYF